MMLEIRDVRKSFSGLTVLDGIDLDVEKGDVVAILGPSGSGKTTFLRCLNYLERADGVLQVQGFFSEAGITGARDALVFALLEKQGEIRVRDSIPEGWVSDPYDPWYTKGVRMNRSEQERFDVLFPAHPLSELRKFVKEIIVDN